MTSENDYRLMLPKHFITESGLARRLPYTVQTLRKYRMAGTTPRPLETGELFLYPVGEPLIEWIKSEWIRWQDRAA